MKYTVVLQSDHNRPPSLAWGSLCILHKAHTLSTQRGVGTSPSCLCGVPDTGEEVSSGPRPDLMQPVLSSLCQPETWGGHGPQHLSCGATSATSASVLLSFSR